MSDFISSITATRSTSVSFASTAKNATSEQPQPPEAEARPVPPQADRASISDVARRRFGALRRAGGEGVFRAEPQGTPFAPKAQGRPFALQGVLRSLASLFAGSPLPPQAERGPVPPESRGASFALSALQPSPPEVQGGPLPPQAQITPVPPQAEITPVPPEREITPVPPQAEIEPVPPEAQTEPVPPEASQADSEVRFARGEYGFEVSRQVTTPNGVTRSRSLAVEADAASQTLSRERSFTAANGDTLTVSGSITRTDGGFERSVTITGPDGGSLTLERSVDAESQSFSRVVTVDADSYDLVRSFSATRTDDGFKAGFSVEYSRDAVDAGTEGAPGDDTLEA